MCIGGSVHCKPIGSLGVISILGSTCWSTWVHTVLGVTLLFWLFRPDQVSSVPLLGRM